MGGRHTAAPRPFADSDLNLLLDALGEDAAARVLYDNAITFYRPGDAATPA